MEDPAEHAIGLWQILPPEWHRPDAHSPIEHVWHPTQLDGLVEKLRRTTNAADLDDALHALWKVADALGIYRETWQAQSIPELGDMLAAEIRRIKGT
jgi:hypothetical protein